jgi:hypothetical protein
VAAVSDTLLPGKSPKTNQKIVSKNGVYTLQMGADGNASLGRPGYPSSWSTSTYRKGSVLVVWTAR